MFLVIHGGRHMESLWDSKPKDKLNKLTRIAQKKESRPTEACAPRFELAVRYAYCPPRPSEAGWGEAAPDTMESGRKVTITRARSTAGGVSRDSIRLSLKTPSTVFNIL